MPTETDPGASCGLFIGRVSWCVVGSVAKDGPRNSGGVAWCQGTEVSCIERIPHTSVELHAGMWTLQIPRRRKSWATRPRNITGASPHHAGDARKMTWEEAEERPGSSTRTLARLDKGRAPGPFSVTIGAFTHWCTFAFAGMEHSLLQGYRHEDDVRYAAATRG